MNETSALLQTLISIPSVNAMGRKVDGPTFFESRLTDFLVDWLRPLDVDVIRQPVSPGRDNLSAVYRCNRSIGRPAAHWLFEVHQDTVPADNMTYPAFEATVEGDRIYGRGACDNKGPMTSMLLAFRDAVQSRAPVDLTLLMSVDEEYTFTGITLFAEQVDASQYTGAIVAEPTDLDVVVAHKGGARWEAWTKGTMCHSSAPSRGVNAIYHMADLLRAIETYATVLADHESDPLLGKPTMSVGVIEGGVAVNIVPDRCTIQIDRRLIPGETPLGAQQACWDWLSQRMGEPGGRTIEFEFGVPWLNLPAMGAEKNVDLADRLLACIRPNKPAVKTKAEPYGSNAAILHRAGVPTVIFGPGSITKAHTADEWVPISEVENATDILRRFLDSP